MDLWGSASPGRLAHDELDQEMTVKLDLSEPLGFTPQMRGSWFGIVRVESGSQAQKLNIEVGAQIRAVNGQRVASQDEYDLAMEQALQQQAGKRLSQELVYDYETYQDEQDEFFNEVQTQPQGQGQGQGLGQGQGQGKGQGQGQGSFTGSFLARVGGLNWQTPPPPQQEEPASVPDGLHITVTIPDDE